MDKKTYQQKYSHIEPYEFEKRVALLFRKMGFKVKLTSKSGDYGVDVIAKDETETVAIQVKRYRPGNNVGNRDVQRLLGAMQLHSIRADKAVIATTSDFTIQAKEQAKETPIELWNGDFLDSMFEKYYPEGVARKPEQPTSSQENQSVGESPPPPAPRTPRTETEVIDAIRRDDMNAIVRYLRKGQTTSAMGTVVRQAGATSEEAERAIATIESLHGIERSNKPIQPAGCGCLGLVLVVAATLAVLC